MVRFVYPVAVAILEECCMTFAFMQKLFLSVERIVAHGPLVHGLMTLQIYKFLSTLAFGFISYKTNNFSRAFSIAQCCNVIL